jgi:hypothetical protein
MEVTERIEVETEKKAEEKPEWTVSPIGITLLQTDVKCMLCRK